MSRTYRKVADEVKCENEADEKELLKHLKRKDRKHGITIVTDGNAHGGIRDKFDDYIEQPGKKRVLKKQKVKKERAEGNDIQDERIFNMEREMTKLNLEITMPTQYINKFLQMLDCMRWCSKTGASRVVAFMTDGDGNFRPFDFKIDGKELESNINWLEFDKDYNPKLNQQLPQPFKTKYKPNFYFDAT